MTEQEWLICTDPSSMLEFLRYRESERKLRLAACACVRRYWHLLSDQRLRDAIEIREKHADGLIGDVDLKQAQWEGWKALIVALVARLPALVAVRAAAEAVGPPNDGFAARARVADDQNDWLDHAEERYYDEVERWLPRVFEFAAAAAQLTMGGPNGKPESTKIIEEARGTAERDQCVLLRCLFGNPLQPLRPAFDLAWLSWHDDLLVSMAHRMYDAHDFADMPILADALEEAGCTDADILNHCRQPGEHVRGCWVVDLLLGKS